MTDTDTDPAEDPNVPHAWFQTMQDDLPGNPSCSLCKLPVENARHRGKFTATITIHGNDLDEVAAEHDGLLAFFYEGEHDLWLSVTDPSGK